MNYTLFYKMIKEAQDSPEESPAAAKSPAKPANEVGMPMRGLGEPTPDVHPSDPNAPAVPTQNTLTADQLAGKWIKDKERFYRSKATKYPQYNNWTVSNQTRNKMIEQAQNMLNAPGGREKAWASYTAPRYGTTSAPYRDEAFEQASIANSAYIDKVNAPAREARRQAEEAQRAQQQPMQNPVAPAAMNNPATPTYTSEQDRLNQAIDGVSNVFYKHFTGTHAGPGGQIFNYQLNNTLRPFYTAIPAYKVQDAFNTDINLNSLPNWGNSDVKRVYDRWQLGNAMLKQQNLGLNPQLTPDRQSALDFANLMRNGDGSGKTIDQLVEEFGDMLDKGEPIPPALEPIKDILIGRRKALKQGL